MRHRIGRNDPCWCGSGIKFKKCHLNRAEQSRPGLQEVIEGVQLAYSSKYCLHPQKAECSGTIIKAHTVQRNGSLSKIARDGKVYSFKGNNIADIKRENGILAPKLVGVATASTFTGFCGHHDNALFAPIEKNPFAASQEHAFLLSYRHLCMEIFAKRSALQAMPLLKEMDRGMPELSQQEVQMFANLMHAGLKKGLQDLETIKDDYDKSLLVGDFSRMHFYAVRINETPELMCCSGIFPTHDFDGQLVQTLDDTAVTADHISFSVIATDNGGAVVFGWLGDSPAALELVKSLAKQSDDNLVQSVLRFAFEFVENSYISPIWWDAQAEATKMAIRKRISKAGDPMEARAIDCLKDDGIKLANWTVATRETNLVF